MTPGKFPETPTWFPDARLNFAENLLYRRDDGVAITEAGESGVIAHVTFKQLHSRVQQMTAALRTSGLTVGDRVAGKLTFFLKDCSRLSTCILAVITNSTNAVVIALAVASIGGIYSSTATDMGPQVS